MNIRSHLEVKKHKEEFVEAFAAYSYLKTTDNKNKLIVDEYAVAVVQDIFRWKLDGMSQQGIADLLNVDGVLCPAEYKRSLGMKYAFGFKHNPQSKWSVGAVGRILKNPLYIGVIDAYEPIIVEKNLEFVAVLLAEDMAVKRIDRQLDEMKADYEQAMHFKMNQISKVSFAQGE